MPNIKCIWKLLTVPGFSLKHFSPIAISICWASSVHTWNRKDIKNRGENSQLCCIGSNIWNITIFKGSHRGAPLPVLTWTWCTWTTTGSGSAGTSPRYTSQVLDTCRVIMVHVLNFRGASMCVESTLCGVHTVDLPCICKLNWHFWKIIFHLIWDKTLKIVIQKVKKVPKIETLLGPVLG